MKRYKKKIENLQETNPFTWNEDNNVIQFEDKNQVTIGSTELISLCIDSVKNRYKRNLSDSETKEELIEMIDFLLTEK